MHANDFLVAQLVRVAKFLEAGDNILARSEEARENHAVIVGVVTENMRNTVLNFGIEREEWGQIRVALETDAGVLRANRIPVVTERLWHIHLRTVLPVLCERE